MKVVAEIQMHKRLLVEVVEEEQEMRKKNCRDERNTERENIRQEGSENFSW